MSFAGHVFDMIARMKALERRKRRPFDKEVEVKGQQVRREFLRDPSEDDLARIRLMMAKEHQQIRRAQVITFSVVLLLVLLLILWARAQ